MSVNYNIVQRIDPRDPNAPKKYYAALVQKDSIDLEYMVDAISNYSTVNPPDVLAVIESLVRLIPIELANGRGVRFGKLGNFYLTANSEGQENEEDVSSDIISKINLRFKPNSKFKKLLGELSFNKTTDNG